jgi:hypothetical protein
MSTPVLFDYNKFYNFYTNNVIWEHNPPWVNYIDRFKVNTKQKQGRFIHIQGKKIYIDTVPMSGDMLSDGLIFSILRDVNGKLWDDHFYFGIKNGARYHRPSIVFFHKTIQDTVTPQKKPTNCYFPPDQDIRNIEIIDCINSTTGSKMASNDKFPITTDDFKIIKMIIQMPFMTLLRAPSPSNTRTSKTSSGGKKYRCKSNKRIRNVNKTIRKRCK